MVTFAPELYERGGALGEQRQQIVQVLLAALRAVDPAEAVRRYLRRNGDTLYINQEPLNLCDYRRIIVVGAGKAGAPMAQAVEEILGDRISAGYVNVKYEHVLPTQLIEINEAGHPVPDEAGARGGQRIAQLLDEAAADDLVLCLISGGGSALMTFPVEGITLQDMMDLTNALLRAGATINEINAIRKHLDGLKGGHLAQRAHPARVVSLILSDVVGNPLDVIASGPTVPDTSTFADALGLLERFGLVEDAPKAIIDHLRAGVAGDVADTPKAGDPVFDSVSNVLVASNGIAAEAAVARAKELGFHALLLSTYIEGEAREVAKVMGALAKEEREFSRPLPLPACIIAGGETTVTLEGSGKGGRNQEMALAAAMSIAGLENVAVVCLATDGTDGPTDASGALADGQTLDRAAELGLDPWQHLEQNNAYPFFAELNDLLLTGPTNTNVNDLTFVFAW